MKNKKDNILKISVTTSKHSKSKLDAILQWSQSGLRLYTNLLVENIMAVDNKANEQ